MEQGRSKILPRHFDKDRIKNYFFPNLEKIDPEFQKVIHQQAGASLLIVFTIIITLSMFIFLLSLFSDIGTLQLVRSLFILLVFFIIIFGLHKLKDNAKWDFALLRITVFFVLWWGVTKDIANFGLEFNAYGFLYVIGIFFGLIFMPYRPVFALVAGLFSSAVYFIGFELFVNQIFGTAWLESITKLIGTSWAMNDFRMMNIRWEEMNNSRFYVAWHILQYLIFGMMAFIFRAANLQSYIKAFITSRALSNKEEELKALQKLLLKPESQHLEFKSSARWDYHQNKTNKALEKVIVKTIAGFLNSEGGILFIGVNDKGEVLGLEKDFGSLQKKDADGFELFLIGLVSKYIGVEFVSRIDVSFVEMSGKEVCSLRVNPSDKPIFIDKMDQAFYVRTGNSTRQLKTKEAIGYIDDHFE
ncbi:MAG: helix-turn-helix domain-containing protein [Candidatus Zixiibacteriota bacterium]